MNTSQTSTADPPAPFVHLSKTPAMAAVRSLLEAAAEARRRGDHGAAAVMERDAGLVLRAAAHDLRAEQRQ